MTGFWLAFVPLFVAVDAIGTLPMFVSFTEGLDEPRIRKVIVQSTFTAMAVALAFLAVGKVVLGLLGITVADFMIAGGVLLFVISLNDILTLEKKQLMVDPESLGAVPLGVPLIAGPAVLTTALLIVTDYGITPTVLATIANILIAGFIFSAAGRINRILGSAGSKTVSKLASLLLAAIAVMMVRRGIMIYIKIGASAPL